MEENANQSTEFQMGPTLWFAQRFMTTISAGRLLFELPMRIPAGSAVPVGSTLDISLYNDSNSGPTGVSLSGSFLPEQIIQWISSSIFSRPQPGKSDPSITGGFIHFPMSNVLQTGTDAVGGGTGNFHWFEFPQQPGKLFVPNTNYWFVMKTTSAAINVYVGVEDASQNTTQYTYDINGNQSSSTTDFGDLFGYFTNNGTVFNFKNGQTSRFQVFGEKALSTTITTPAQGQSAQFYMTEPVTGLLFPAVSLMGQDHIASEIAFKTALVARRNSQGFIDVAIPLSAGGFVSANGDGLVRLDYTCTFDFIAFK